MSVNAPFRKILGLQKAEELKDFHRRKMWSAPKSCIT